MTTLVPATFRRIWVASVARSYEYLRDSNSLIKTLLMPLALIVGIAFTFSGHQQPLFKVAVVGGGEANPNASTDVALLRRIPLVQFYDDPNAAAAVRKVESDSLPVSPVSALA